MKNYQSKVPHDYERVGEITRATPHGEIKLGVYCDNKWGDWFTCVEVTPFLGRCDINRERYSWRKPKLPEGYTWKAAKMYKDLSYDFTRTDFLVVGTDLVVRFRQPSVKKNFTHQKDIYLTIKKFRELTADEILGELCGYDSLDRVSDAYYLMGRCFEEGIREMMKEERYRLWKS